MAGEAGHFGEDRVIHILDNAGNETTIAALNARAIAWHRQHDEPPIEMVDMRGWSVACRVGRHLGRSSGSCHGRRRATGLLPYNRYVACECTCHEVAA